MKGTKRTTWRSPSNIALVKYWGKKGIQLPMNPSVSMTLTSCYTETAIEYTEKKITDNPGFTFLFEGKKNLRFEEKIGAFLKTALKELPVLEQLQLNISSSNSFPHSAGIASSASSMSSLALCLCQINREVSGIEEDEELFLKKASHLARLGSGSACRSIYGGWVLWGEIREIEYSSDDYAVPVSYLSDKIFRTFYDAILIVDSGVKQVPSSMGHRLMESNPYKEEKIKTSIQNAHELIHALKNGNEKHLRDITEYEAANLHAMFLTSNPYYVLIMPETLHIINKLKRLREDTGIPFTFTLDAGPNIHLLYPEAVREKMVSFIKSELTPFCENGRWIDDKIGKGPELVQS